MQGPYRCGWWCLFACTHLWSYELLSEKDRERDRRKNRPTDSEILSSCSAFLISSPRLWCCSVSMSEFRFAVSAALDIVETVSRPLPEKHCGEIQWYPSCCSAFCLMFLKESCGNAFSSIFGRSFLFVSDQACDCVWMRSTVLTLESFFANVSSHGALPLMSYTSRLNLRLKKISTKMEWCFGGREQLSSTPTRCTRDDMFLNSLAAGSYAGGLTT